MPKYENDCNHAPEEFLGTVCLHGEEGDLYFYIDEKYFADGEGLRFCFRYGVGGAYMTGAAAEFLTIMKHNRQTRSQNNDNT